MEEWHLVRLRWQSFAFDTSIKKAPVFATPREGEEKRKSFKVQFTTVFCAIYGPFLLVIQEIRAIKMTYAPN